MTVLWRANCAFQRRACPAGSRLCLRLFRSSLADVNAAISCAPNQPAVGDYCFELERGDVLFASWSARARTSSTRRNGHRPRPSSGRRVIVLPGEKARCHLSGTSAHGLVLLRRRGRGNSGTATSQEASIRGDFGSLTARDRVRSWKKRLVLLGGRRRQDQGEAAVNLRSGKRRHRARCEEGLKWNLSSPELPGRRRRQRPLRERSFAVFLDQKPPVSVFSAGSAGWPISGCPTSRGCRRIRLDNSAATSGSNDCESRAGRANCRGCRPTSPVHLIDGRQYGR